MRKLLLVLVLFASAPAGAQSIPETYVNHAWVDGVYWNQAELPGWGFFADVQEETLFGAIYGYLDGEPTFITLQGTLTSENPLRFSGDVYFVTNNGSSASDTGDFTWEVSQFQASPAAKLTISSNILNKTDLSLVRFSYVESDRVDMLTAGNWNIVRRVLGESSGASYAISDERIVEDGITFAAVYDNSAPENIGAVGHFPPEQGDLFAMAVQIDADTYDVYVFHASDTEMFGRHWQLDETEEPTGNGNYFHGAADTLQMSHQENPLAPAGLSAQAMDGMKLPGPLPESQSGTGSAALFPEAMVRDALRKLIAVHQTEMTR
jgi:hypothetical protein